MPENYTPPFIEPTSQPSKTLFGMIDRIKHPIKNWDTSVYTDKFFPVQRFPRKRVIVKDEDSLREVFLNRNDYYGCDNYFRKLVQPLWGDGLLICDQDNWRWQRKTASHAFTSIRSRAVIPQAIRRTRASISKWTSSSVRTDFFRDLSNLATEISYDALIGNSGDTPEDITEFNMAANDFSQAISTVKLAEYFKFPGWINKRTGPTRQASASQMKAVINNKIEVLSKKSLPQENLLAEFSKSENPLTQKPISKELLLDNITGILIAGRDTMGITLFWALHTIASCPNVHEGILDEIDSVTSGASVAAEHINNLHYLRNVIYETLRLFPPGPILVRQCLSDVTLNGQKLREGTSIKIPVYAIHRDPHVWENPHNFRPERFDDKSLKKNTKSFSYLPFGGGKKICIARGQALLELISVIATLLQNVEIEFSTGQIGVEFSGGLLKPNKSVAVSIKHLKNNQI